MLNSPYYGGPCGIYGPNFNYITQLSICVTKHPKYIQALFLNQMYVHIATDRVMSIYLKHLLSKIHRYVHHKYIVTKAIAWRAR